MKTLIIDDSKFQRVAIQRALVRAGHDVTTAGDGEEGLRVASAAQPDLIILDMLLPKVSGIEVLRSLRREAKTRAVPVIVLTGLSEKNKEKLIAEGATAFMEKSMALSNGDCGALIDAIGRLS
ncbi:MAG TPA: response regulator [Terriglobales bacterium]|jgi:twitching motility two-component system response regulator PilH|nr:response regulator [Terriglobales bacterium]